MTDVVIASAARTAIGSYGRGWRRAIALGRPIGATGAALTANMLDEMKRRDLELGLVTLYTGGGQGIALLLGRG